MGRNIVYSQISFDVTRKCNLNCDFCTKGEPQNMTITKAIVDKTFKELKDSHVLILRLFGGEPFLSEDMIVYILKQAIKKLSFYNLAIDTNGTIYSSKVADAIKRVCIHLSDNVKYPPLAESTSIKVGNQ